MFFFFNFCMKELCVCVSDVVWRTSLRRHVCARVCYPLKTQQGQAKSCRD